MDEREVREERQRNRPETRRTGSRRRRNSRARRRRKLIRRILLFLVIIILVAAAGGFFIWKKYGPSKEKADLNKYYGLTQEEDLAVVINNRIAKSRTDGMPAGRIIDGQPYVEYSVVRDYINERFYWDPNENIMLYTLPNGNVSVTVGSSDYTSVTDRKSKNYVILKTEGRVAYIALPFVQEYTGMDFSVYENPNRVSITCGGQTVQTAVLKKDTEVRYQGGVKSPILTTVKKSDKVTVLEDEDDWKKIATSDGFIGYVKTGTLKKMTEETITQNFEEPEYTNRTVDYIINMAWHNVEHEDANNYVLQTIAQTKGLTTIAPTWFSIADVDGNLSSIADSDYVNYAHQSNLDVWVVLRDFHGGINSYDETYQVLSYTSKRERLANQVIGAALQAGVDGINLDFELISTECGEHYIQFVRELSVKCRQNGLVFSVDNYVPQPYNEHYNLKEQSVVADYVVIMAYDEHTEGSYEAGSVASYNYTKQGIEDALESVPKEKLVAGVPFYTRLWFETMKTEEELREQAGTDAAAYLYNVSSTALGMDEALQTVQNAGVQIEWNETAKQNYAQWDADGGTYKIWLEDAQSLEEKLKLIKAENLAGVAEWKLGAENTAIWDLILQYVN
ncbi:MAG: glycosyl hydrolase family 18 protein [Schaedlerella sp.]|nr:glycosyl hydrolase family 18 protein [Lachnospiraceae bacterium]MDY4202188.1 glycosyl hydrolase family 18 protein [Schaedlerella sp.]